jgi:hypothetical protein
LLDFSRSSAAIALSARLRKTVCLDGTGREQLPWSFDNAFALDLIPERRLIPAMDGPWYEVSEHGKRVGISTFGADYAVVIVEIARRPAEATSILE